MILHRQVALGLLTVLFLAGAVFCYAGYSIAAAEGEPGGERAAILYGVGVICGVLGALASGVATWRADRPVRGSMNPTGKLDG